MSDLLFKLSSLRDTQKSHVVSIGANAELDLLPLVVCKKVFFFFPNF